MEKSFPIGSAILIVIMSLLWIGVSIYNWIEEKRNKAIAADVRAANKKAFRYYKEDIPVRIMNHYDYLNGFSRTNKPIINLLLNDIYRKHEVILNSTAKEAVRIEIDTLLNTELFKLESDFLEIINANAVNIRPEEKQEVTYQEIFVEKLEDISNYLDKIIEKKVLNANLLSFDIKEFNQQNSLLAASASLIEPLQNKGLALLSNIPVESETYFLINKLVNEYLPQVAIDYYLALNQPLSNVDRQPQQVFEDITYSVHKYFDDIEKGQNVAMLQYQQDHYNNLIVFERYLKAREII